jgi:hypothetical protein
MKGKILFAVGLGVGYVLGTRAGREKYEKIKRSAQWMWDSPAISDAREHVDTFVKSKTPDVAEGLAAGVKKVVARIAGKPAPATTSHTAGSSGPKTSTPRSKPAAKKLAAKKPAAKKPAAKPAAESAE